MTITLNDYKSAKNRCAKRLVHSTKLINQTQVKYESLNLSNFPSLRGYLFDKRELEDKLYELSFEITTLKNDISFYRDCCNRSIARHKADKQAYDLACSDEHIDF
jgi:hypothetical protein